PFRRDFGRAGTLAATRYRSLRNLKCRPRESGDDKKVLRTEPLEEGIYLAADAASDIAEIVGYRFNRSGAGARVFGSGAEQVHFVGSFHRALGGDLDAARDFRRCGALLGDGGGDGAADVADFTDDMLDRRDRLDRTHRGALHTGNLRGYFLGSAAGLAGQLFY